MGKQIGMFVTLNEFGSTVTDKVRQYDTYEEMIADTTPPRYGIVDNVVYHWNGEQWTVGFPNIAEMGTCHNDNDYTAFEVFAHNEDIPVGESEELGGYVNNMIPAGMTEYFRIRSSAPQDGQNVVVDWGDGATTLLSTITPEVTDSSLYTYIYDVEHTYTSPGKYIVKILGKTYNSIIGSNITTDPTGTRNLMCRIFDKDLPIASHLTNFSSFALSSQCLLYVNATNSNFTHQVVQCPSLLRNCTNLIKAQGFNNCTNIIECNSMFYKDSSLQYTDFALPNKLADHTSTHSCFGECPNLEMDVSWLIPTAGFFGRVKTTNIFRNCAKLYGTVPANVLWEDTKVEWTSTDRNMFLGCSAAIRSQVPTSWGGTNANLENLLKVKDKSYYSAVEVYPTESALPVGRDETLNGDIISEVPAKMQQILVFRTYINEADKENADIVVDWGDGTVNTLSNAATMTDTDVWSPMEKNYALLHNYTTQQKYIIKIYGKDYFGIKTSYIKEGTTIRTNSNQICRIFSDDLPIAPHVTDLSYICFGANKLLTVDIRNNISLTNGTAMFRDCRNLQHVQCSDPARLSNKRSYMFYHCYNLTYSNVTVPFTYGESEAMYRVCRNLEVDIATLFDYETFDFTVKATIDTFMNCAKLTGDVPASFLWNNKNITYTTSDNVFTGCSTAIRAQVPVSWGGTLAS